MADDVRTVEKRSLAAWLERPVQKVGLDNLGTQQPCVFVYTSLLPGITNVTDRAAYFGYYPWFIRAFERRHPNASDQEFRDTLRRADVLVTLIAERHQLVSNDQDEEQHAGQCPGTQKLAPAALALDADSSVNINEYSDRREENTKRYFKNPLGGLGQYYLGPLRDEHRILHGDAGRGVRYTNEFGAPVADLYASGLDEELFFFVVNQGFVRADQLDVLKNFCPCSLKEPDRAPARDALGALLLNDGTPGGITRRRTFALILKFLRVANGAEAPDMVRAFLHACYGGVLPTGASWTLDAQHEATRTGWALYARNEMMSLAWIALFKLSLDEMDGTPKPFPNVLGLCNWLSTTEVFDFDLKDTFGNLVANDRATAPSLDQLNHPSHETAYWKALANTTTPIANDAWSLLVRLVARFGTETNSYAAANVPRASLAAYPLTLETLNQNAVRWKDMQAKDWAKALLVEVLVAHQRIAIRKLGQSGEDTLMFRANDLGYSVHRPQPRVVQTQPRLKQAFQLLRDLALIEFRNDHLPHLTPLGKAQLVDMGL